MSESGNHEYGPPVPSPDGSEVNIHHELDFPEPGEVSPEMQLVSQQFAQSMQEIFAARQQAAQNMLQHGTVAGSANDTNTQVAIFARCNELEADAIEKELYYSTHVADPRLDLSYLGWELDGEDSQTYFSAKPDMLVRMDKYSAGDKKNIHETTYSVAEGHIFQEIVAEEDTGDGTEDEDMDLTDRQSEVDLHDGEPLSRTEADIFARTEGYEGDFDSRALTLSEARRLTKLTGSLRDVIIKKYQSQGLLDPAKS